MKSAALSPQTLKYFAGKDPGQSFNRITTGAYNAEDGFANCLKGGLVGGLKGGVVGTVAGGALGAAGGRFAPKNVRNTLFDSISLGATPEEIRTELLRRATINASLFR